MKVGIVTVAWRLTASSTNEDRNAHRAGLSPWRSPSRRLSSVRHLSPADPSLCAFGADSLARAAAATPSFSFGAQQQQQPQQQQQQQPAQGSSLFGAQPSATPATTAGSSLFGGAAQPATSGASSLFGGQQQQQQGSNEPAAKKTFFGASSAAPASSTQLGASSSMPSLFGAGQQQQQQQPQQTGGGLFGGASTSTPAPTGGLFGSTSQPQQQQQQQSGGGLFGASQPQQQAGGLFGSSTTSQPAQTGGLFGNASTSTPAQTGGLFGSTPATTTGGSLFGQQQPSTGLFGGTAFGAQQQSQQQQQQQQKPAGFGSSFGLGTSQNAAQMSLFGPKPVQPLGASSAQQPASAPVLYSSQLAASQAPSKAPPPALGASTTAPGQPIEARMQAIANAWDTANPSTCALQTYFYNIVEPPLAPSQFVKPPAADEAKWLKAQRENPEPSRCVTVASPHTWADTAHRLTPAIAIGFDAVRRRVDQQEAVSAAHAAKLREMREHIDTLRTAHALDASVRLERAYATQRKLAQRLARLVARSTLIRVGRNAPMTEQDEQLRRAAEHVRERANENEAQLNELWAAVARLRAQSEHSRAVNAESAGVEWAVSDEEAFKQILQVRSLRALAFLSRALTLVPADLGVAAGRTGPPCANTRWRGQGCASHERGFRDQVGVLRRLNRVSVETGCCNLIVV